MTRNLKFLVKDIEEATITAARTACVQIMNGLVEVGPAYKGEFASSWYAVEKGQAPGGVRKPGRSTDVYKYDLRNVPKTKFKAGTWYEIVNGAPHAAVAMDLVDGVFRYEGGPIKDPVNEGSRYGGRRGEVSDGSGNSVSTAELDWWPTYNVGGNLQKDLAKGVQEGFGKARGFKA